MDSAKLFRGADVQALKRAVEIGGFGETITYHSKNPGAYSVNFETGAVTGGDTTASIKVFLYRFHTEEDRPDTSGGLDEADGLIWANDATLDASSIKISTRDWFADSDSLRYEIVSVSPVQTGTTCAAFRRVS